MLRDRKSDRRDRITPQKHLGSPKVYEVAGKALGGGSVTNYGILFPLLFKAGADLLMRLVDSRRSQRMLNVGQGIWTLQMAL